MTPPSGMPPKIIGAIRRAWLAAAWDPRLVQEEVCSLRDQGVDIVDIGCTMHSPRKRKAILSRLPALLSALKPCRDAFFAAQVLNVPMAHQAILSGVRLIMDVGGFADPVMRRLAAESEVEVHLRHSAHGAGEDIVSEVGDWLDKQSQLLIHDGVEAARIIIDPGIGVGKTTREDLRLLGHLATFRSFGSRLLVDGSCSSFFTKGVDSGLNLFLALSGVDIVRVRDAVAYRRTINLLSEIAKA